MFYLFYLYVLVFYFLVLHDVQYEFIVFVHAKYVVREIVGKKSSLNQEKTIFFPFLHLSVYST
jgi:hypothetical protein